MEFQARFLAFFLLFSVIEGFGWFWMGSLHKNIQLMLEFLKASFLVLHFSYYTIFLLHFSYYDLPDDVICNIDIYADDTTLYSQCDQASDLRQKLELASELESDLRDTVYWGSKWLVYFSSGKTQLISFDRSGNTSAIYVKMDGSVLLKLLCISINLQYGHAWNTVVMSGLVFPVVTTWNC